MKYSFLLLSAGKGSRFGKSMPKQYLMFSGKPMIVHILERINRINEIDEIVIVCCDEYINTIKSYLENYRINKNVVFAKGGESRQQSVYNGLLMCKNDDIILHEAARPLVTLSDYRELIRYNAKNVTYSYEIPYTVLKKNDNNQISGILNRTELINIQLPQKFSKSDLLQAHLLAKKEGKTFTEDASMIYYINKPVYCIKGKVYNIKMTEYSDLIYGELLIKEDFLGGDEY